MAKGQGRLERLALALNPSPPSEGDFGAAGRVRRKALLVKGRPLSSGSARLAKGGWEDRHGQAWTTARLRKDATAHQARVRWWKVLEGGWSCLKLLVESFFNRVAAFGKFKV